METERSGSGTAMLESVLSLLVEEVKELRHATQQLRDEHMLLASEVAALQQRQAERENDRERAAHPGSANLSPSSDTSSPFSAPNASSFTSTSSAYISRFGGRNQPMLARHDLEGTSTSMSTSTSISPPASTSSSFAPPPAVIHVPQSTSTYPSSQASTSASASAAGSVVPRPGYNAPASFVSTASTSHSIAYTRREIINYLPFLSKYPIASPDAPFAIDDLSRPFAAVRRVSGVPGEWEYSPPIFVFANDAFCSMVKYPLNELLGCPLSKVMFPDEQIKRKMNPFIAQKTPYPLSDLIYHSALCVTKDGKLFRFPSKYQICYSEHGQARWGIICGTGEPVENVTFETHIPAAASAASFFARERDDPTAMENLQWAAVDWASNATGNGQALFGAAQAGGFLTGPPGDGPTSLVSRGSKINSMLAANTTRESADGVGRARITELEPTESNGGADIGIDLLSFPSPLPSPLASGVASGDFSWLLQENPPFGNERGRPSLGLNPKPNPNTKW